MDRSRLNELPLAAVGLPVLEVDQLVVDYGPVRAVDQVSFQVFAGEVVGLLGPNGAGKTSLLSVVEGLVAARSGRVTVAGVDARQHPTAARAQMGVQLQQTAFQPDLTLIQLVRLYGGLQGMVLGTAEAIVGLERVGLLSEARRRFSQLSGGQQQRLALLVALIHEPALALLDEPTTGLDPQSRRELWDRIERLAGEGTGVVLTTHSMEEAAALADRLVIMHRGRVRAAGPPKDLVQEFQDNPAVARSPRGQAVTLEDVFLALTGGAQ